MRMPPRRAFTVSLIVGLVVFSTLAVNRATQHAMTGTVVEVEDREWMSVVNETTDPTGARVTLRETTAYEGNAAAIKPGARVTVWYRSVGERRPVADRVRVLSDAPDPVSPASSSNKYSP
jgi:hypothetical protein